MGHGREELERLAIAAASPAQHLPVDGQSFDGPGFLFEQPLADEGGKGAGVDAHEDTAEGRIAGGAELALLALQRLFGVDDCCGWVGGVTRGDAGFETHERRDAQERGRQEDLGPRARGFEAGRRGWAGWRWGGRRSLGWWAELAMTIRGEGRTDPSIGAVPSVAADDETGRLDGCALGDSG